MNNNENKNENKNKNDNKNENKNIRKNNKSKNKSKTGSELMNKLLQLRNQMKVYHWQTKLHSRHIAADKFLGKAEDIIDQIIEAYQGRYGTIYFNSNNKNIKLGNISDDDIEKYLKTVREFLVSDYNKFLDVDTNTDLLNLRDELLSSIDITIYLFHQRA